MRAVLYFGILVALASSHSGFAMEDKDPLSRFLWKHRVVLVFEKPEAVSALEASPLAIAERDLIWFVIEGASWETNDAGTLPDVFASGLNRYRKSSPGAPEIILIGKDGQVKGRDTELDLPSIFARIDAMPMRRLEMRHGSGSEKKQGSE
jgi:hypothetical protein